MSESAQVFGAPTVAFDDPFAVDGDGELPAFPAVDERTRIVPVEANRRLALAIYQGDELDQVLWLVLRDGRIAQALAVRNPDKLTRLVRPAT